MNTEMINHERGALAFLTFLLVLSGTVAAEIIPGSRRVVWQGNVGVAGDIPDRTAIFANIKDAPYSAIGDGVADDTVAIKRAITDCPAGKVVLIPAGIYKVSSRITVKSGITVRGAGTQNTIIKGAAGFTDTYLIGFYAAGTSWNLSNQPAHDITAGFEKGSTRLTTLAPHGWTAGDIIVIDQLQSPDADPPVVNKGIDGTCTWCGRDSGNRPFGQVSRIISIPSATTAVLEIPLYWNYEKVRAPQAVKMTGITQEAGIENLTVDNSESGNTNQGNSGTITFTMTSNCWLKKVDTIGSWKNMLRMYGGYRNTIRGCSFHEGVPALPATGQQYGSSRGYGIYLNPWASANLIEDNQFYHLSVGIIMNGAVSGNVFAYNYLTAMYYTNANWQRQTILPHGAHPFMNLIEGNWSDGTLGADCYWGSSSDNTIFRNRHSLTPGKTCGTWAIDLYQKSHYYNIVGNVLGTAGVENTYQLENADFGICPGERAVYRFGYTSAGDATAAGNDPAVKSTMIRHGNWDSVNNAVIWDSGIADKVLPSSLYLAAKPAWWGDLSWPPIGPDLTRMYNNIPARRRYSGTLKEPSNLRIIK